MIPDSSGRRYLARVAIFLIMAALIAGMVGCVGATLTLTITSTEGGEVTTPGEGTFAYDEGTVVNLLAEAEEGYYFVEWIGSVSAIADVNAATTTITMKGHHFITANFAPGQFTLTISSTVGGSVTTPGEGTYVYAANATTDLVAMADEHYHFVNWTGNVDTIADVNAAATNITMYDSYSITAPFGIAVGGCQQ